jgi:predicted nucleic acid-binding protein
LTPVLLDTGCIVALLDRSEQYHAPCRAAVGDLEVPLMTCEAVIAEACYLLRHIKGAALTVLINVERGTFLIPYRLTGRTASVQKLLKKYADVPMHFADACLLDMAEEYQTGRIFTLDRDFHYYRWAKNRPFEMVLDL